MATQLQQSELARLRALRELDLLDTEPEGEFNDLVSLASELCNAPISLLTLLDENRQWFKAARGLSTRETQRSIAFCDRALLQDDIFVVSNAAEDPRFADNPLVTGDPHIRFYAGALIHSPEGHKLGTLCIIDREPRELGWREAQILTKLSRQASLLIELRQRRRAEEAQKAATQALEARGQALLAQLTRLHHLAHLQGQNVSAFFENGIDPLYTPRISKKEINEIAEKATSFREQIAANNEALTLLASYRLGNATLAHPIRIAEFALGIFGDLTPAVKKSGNRVQPLISSDLTLRQNERALSFLFRTLLGCLLGALRNADITLSARRRDNGVQFDIQIPEHNLVEALERYMPDAPALGSEYLTGRPFRVELALAKDIVLAMGGTKTLDRLGNRGTAIGMFLPDAPETAS